MIVCILTAIAMISSSLTLKAPMEYLIDKTAPLIITKVSMKITKPQGLLFFIIV